jgi:hypothetical protein
MTIGTGTLASLARLRSYRSKRVSSWDRTGANADYVLFEQGENKVIADIREPGCIKHIWMTCGANEPAWPRRMVLRMFWDNEETPSVEVPLGDFFGIGHGIIKNFTSLPLTMSPAGGRGFNSFFPMPFAKGARIEVLNEGAPGVPLYFYVDYEGYDALEGGLARFHAQWRRQNPCQGWGEDITRERLPEVWSTPNLDGKDNYIILEAEGRGHYVGCNLNIDCFARQKNDWYGEGDDMIFIDGEGFPPSLHGTGTEDYFNTAYCPQEVFSAPYHGLTVYSGTPDWPWKGKNSVYRFHIEDPIHFEHSIVVGIEHGHANNLSNDYSSTAYWYQEEPHLAFPVMLPLAERLPRPSEPLWEPTE